MSDLIRREDALAVLCFSQETGQMVCGDLRKLLGEIKALPSAEPERTAKVETNWATYFDNMGTAIIHIPYSYKCENCGCQMDRTYNGKDIHYCPACGSELIWQ